MRSVRTGEAAVEAGAWLRDARLVLVLTGAGMSRESGVPTFRDAQTGIWARFDPRELATPEAFEANPARVFSWYLTRLRAVRRATPHAGYKALVELENLCGRLAVVTQNVDGLHRRAGSSLVVELHGSLERFRCFENGHDYDPGRLPGAPDDEAGELEPPSCDLCGSPIRPGVVWFGEPLPPDATRAAWALAEECDVALVIGTSAIVYPAAELPHVAARGGARIVEINPDRTELSDRADLWWSATAGEALPALVSVLKEAAH